MTFSIAGFDPDTQELGIAVQSKFLGVGAVVPWAKAGVGAVATQAQANPAYGPDGLELMKQGKTAQETVDQLIRTDYSRASRQIGIVDAHGGVASYTGENCNGWAGNKAGTHYTAQGNILVGQEPVEAMGERFENTTATLAERLLAALEAGQAAGGDKRGQQSAALVVVKEHGGYLGANDRYIDLRVDEHTDPITELQRICRLHQLYFGVTRPEDVLKLEGHIFTDVVASLKRLGYITSATMTNDDLIKALNTFIHQENFENRELKPYQIDAKVFTFLKEAANGDSVY